MALDDEASAREVEQWRAKYYDNLAQLDHKEKAWRQTENVLRQCISRLTLAADSSDARLNDQLDRLRTAIRKNVNSDELERLIQTLSEQLVELDKAKRSRVKPPAPLAVLRQLADGIAFPRGMGHKAKALQKQLAGSPKDDDYTPQLKALTALIGEAIDWAAEAAAEAVAGAPAEEQPAGGGLFGKLLRRNGTAAPAETGQGQPPLDLAKALLAQLLHKAVAPSSAGLAELDRRLRGAQREEELRRLVDELAALMARQNLSESPRPDVASPQEPPAVPPPPVQPTPSAPVTTPTAAEVLPPSRSLPPQEVLLQLVERFAVPADLHAQVDAIKATLAAPLPEGELDRTLSAVADLVTAMRARVQNEKAEIESFLKQLTENLRELDQNLRNAMAAHRDTVQDGRDLDATVQEQVKEIEVSVQQAHDLNQLKQVVQQRVDTIRRHMEVFRRTEDERIERAEREVESLNRRLHELDHEAEALRTRVQQERQQALIDPLTEIYNRFAYNERVAQEYARWRRYHAPLVFTVWDVDNFKRINDTYGHQAGDKVLKVVAKVLSSQIRETDFVARYGGEEFVILLPETEMANGRRVAEKVRTAVEKSEFHYRGERVVITISCGLATFANDDTPDTVFARADAALYRAKAAGRNRCVADSDPA